MGLKRFGCNIQFKRSPRADPIEIFRGLASVLILNVIFASLCNERSIKETLTNTCKYYY